MANSLHGLEEYLGYEPETGTLYWKIRKGPRALVGSVAGHLKKNGYIEIRSDGKNYMAHRLAWYLHFGVDPGEYEIDHINCDKADNRIQNLRLATQRQNSANTKKKTGATSKYKGVNWHKKVNRWTAQIKLDDKSFHLGYFNTEEEAHAEYCIAAENIYGEHARPV